MKARYGVQLNSGTWYEVELEDDAPEWDIEGRFLGSSDWIAATNPNSPDIKFKIRSKSIVAFYRKSEMEL